MGKLTKVRLAISVTFALILSGCSHTYEQHSPDYTLFMTDAEWLYWHGLGPEDRDDY